MYSKIYSGTALGIDGLLVTVETDISQGLPGLSLVGYLASSVKESGERVRAAIKNTGLTLPARKITVNLSPADIRKDGAGYDLAIAVGIMCSLQYIPITESTNKMLSETLFIGELGLDGRVLPVSGVLPIVDYAFSIGIKNVVVPHDNKDEATFVKNVNVFPVKHLEEVIKIFREEEQVIPYKRNIFNPVANNDSLVDLADIKGQEAMKRGIMIAVAGFHNILLTGAAGSGKSMIAKCIPGIMPPLTYEESMELTKIYSVAGELGANKSLMNRRPFRSPGQNISVSALVGGGAIPKPGEVSLASGGVMFLDEFPEFGRNVIESLRQPMEDKRINISRVKASYSFPARFMLVAARNNCPCGFYPDRNKCRCNAGEIYKYQNRISHPIMDRIDIRIEVHPVGFNELFSRENGMSSEEAREKILIARKRQEYRFRNESFIYNAEIPQNRIEDFIHLGKEETELLKRIYEESEISARGYFKMLRLVRTIADIEDREKISIRDIEEAAFYRNETIERGSFL